jgi:transitional endoplasmic reticulum ATPase
MEDISHERVCSQWSDHTSAKKLDTESFTLDLLRRSFPGHRVTRTSPTTCDLLGFARAGHATAQIAADSLDATRVFRAPPSRVDGESGRLEDAVTFGRWDFTYGEAQFVVYELSYLDHFARLTRRLYVLSLRTPHQTSSTSTNHYHHHPVTDDLLFRCGEWTLEAHETVWVFDNAKWTKDKGLWKTVQDTSWDDIVVSPAVRSRLDRDVHGFFDNRDLYRKAKIPWKRGVIFHGVPGVGKTLFIKTLMRSLAERSPSVPTLYVKSLDACAGPKWSIQQIFKKARRAAPCLLVLEDLDSLVGEHTRSYFLNEVDGLSSNDGILMIGSTNHLERLDPAVTRRPSRFDRKYLFSVPTEAERLAYCQYWRCKYADSEDVEFPGEVCGVVAKVTEGFTFAYLKELFVSSLVLLVSSGQVGIDEAEEEEEEEEEETAGEVTGSARNLPKVDIPPSVQGNQLLRTIMKQAKGLLQDMEATPTTATQEPNAARPPPPQFRMESLLDDPDE